MSEQTGKHDEVVEVDERLAAQVIKGARAIERYAKTHNLLPVDVEVNLEGAGVLLVPSRDRVLLLVLGGTEELGVDSNPREVWLGNVVEPLSITYTGSDGVAMETQVMWSETYRGDGEHHVWSSVDGGKGCSQEPGVVEVDGRWVQWRHRGVEFEWEEGMKLVVVVGRKIPFWCDGGGVGSFVIGQEV